MHGTWLQALLRAHLELLKLGEGAQKSGDRAGDLQKQRVSGSDCAGASKAGPRWTGEMSSSSVCAASGTTAACRAQNSRHSAAKRSAACLIVGQVDFVDFWEAGGELARDGAGQHPAVCRPAITRAGQTAGCRTARMPSTAACHSRGFSTQVTKAASGSTRGQRDGPSMCARRRQVAEGRRAPSAAITHSLTHIKLLEVLQRAQALRHLLQRALQQCGVQGQRQRHLNLRSASWGRFTCRGRAVAACTQQLAPQFRGQ